jgi:aspartyl-tRNA(Asn)/glutamyl-tRNA(Gln) amidotransferase subunit A
MEKPNSIKAALDAMAAGHISSVALTEACLSRIEDRDGEGARAFLAINRARALIAARESDELRRRGQGGPLCGIPISVKDLFDVAGEVTKAGSVVLKNAPAATQDATAIARLKAAGAVIVGRTNMTEFAYSGIGINPHYGTPLSPYNRSVGHVPGGSSSGGAVSVSDGMALAAIGSDTGGSTRIPAAFCGITGYRPTAERIPQDGVFPLASTFDSVGAMAQTVADCRLLDAIMSGAGVAGKSERRDRPVLGLATGSVMAELDPAVEKAYARALGVIGAAGFAMTEARGIDWTLPGALLAEGRITAVECHAAHGDLLKRIGEYDPRVAQRIMTATGFPAVSYVAARRKIMRLRLEMARILAAYDAIVMPTVAITPPILADLAGDEAFFAANARVLRNTLIANVLDCCAITIPIEAPGEPPVGLMLMAPGFTDARLFDLAEMVESACRRSLA